MNIFKYSLTEYIVNDMFLSSVFRPRPCYDESGVSAVLGSTQNG